MIAIIDYFKTMVGGAHPRHYLVILSAAKNLDSSLRFAPFRMTDLLLSHLLTAAS
jgi:hypothetical protein